MNNGSPFKNGGGKELEVQKGRPPLLASSSPSRSYSLCLI